MDHELLNRMKEDSSKKDPMIPRTVRLPRELDGKIQTFANEKELDFSVVIRAILMLGWDEFNKR
jgi:hypothetical protein